MGTSPKKNGILPTAIKTTFAFFWVMESKNSFCIEIIIAVHSDVIPMHILMRVKGNFKKLLYLHFYVDITYTCYHIYIFILKHIRLNLKWQHYCLYYKHIGRFQTRIWRNVSFHLLLMIMIGFLPGSSNFPLIPGFTNALIFLSVV